MGFKTPCTISLPNNVKSPWKPKTKYIEKIHNSHKAYENEIRSKTYIPNKWKTAENENSNDFFPDIN